MIKFVNYELTPKSKKLEKPQKHEITKIHKRLKVKLICFSEILCFGDLVAKIAFRGRFNYRIIKYGFQIYVFLHSRIQEFNP